MNNQNFGDDSKYNSQYINTNNQPDCASSNNAEENEDEEECDEEYPYEIELFIHLTLITKLVEKDSEGNSKCICKNISIQECSNCLQSKCEELKTDNSNIKKESIINSNNSNNNINISHKQEQESPENQKLFLETEIIPSLKVKSISENKLFINNLLKSLKLLGYPTTGSHISIYYPKLEEYVYFGSEPIDNNLYVEKEEVDFDCLKIKLVAYIDEKLVKRTEKQLFDRKDILKKQKEKRTKERKIGTIVEKVNAWRKLYNGFYNDKGEHIRYSLDQAAKIINISKKSLDDYLLQLRLGRKYGFDFNANKNNKVGILRNFVKMHKHLQDEKEINIVENNTKENENNINNVNSSIAAINNENENNI